MYRKPIVTYLRVSTDKQDLESQWMAIDMWAKTNNITIDERIIEEEPASGAEDNRPRFQELWSRVKEGKIGTIVVAELSRLSRRMRTLVNFLYDCFENNVMVVSIREGWLEDAMKNDIVRPIIIAVFGTLYELERKMISERTKAGIARVKAQGKHVGHPFKLSDKEVKIIVKLYREGVPIKRIAERLGVSRATVYRYLKRVGEK
ncbi:MAG: recombinase family protein [Crenarchaeota archaeon]|nr:recombinase family protein [Thermoproteota archaeon]